MDAIEIFLQGAGIPKILTLTVPSNGRVREIIEIAKEQGLKWTADQEVMVWIENLDEPLDLDILLVDAGIKKHTRLHVHTCHRVNVTVNFQDKAESHFFAPSTTISVVKKWADKKFGLSEADATEYALQLCNSTERPAEDVHLGTLVTPSECAVCFDLVPKQRIEG